MKPPPIRPRAVTGRYEVAKPFRDRGVSGRVVRCPACSAEPGDDCVRISDGQPTTFHPTRRRMAVRLDNTTRLEQTP